MLSHRLWRVHDIRLETKIAVYRAAMLSSLLYCCESWCFCANSSSNSICVVFGTLPGSVGRPPLTCWKCQSDSTEATLMKHQFCWVVHVIRMPDRRLPKHIFMASCQLVVAHTGPATALQGRAET